MPKKLIIPRYAKRTAKLELLKRRKLPKYKKPGTIIGVNQAKFLIKNKCMDLRQAMRFYKFYQRFKNCNTRKCKGAMNLWGGKKFLKFKVVKYIKQRRRKK